MTITMDTHSDSSRDSNRRSSSRGRAIHKKRTRLIQALGASLILSVIINLFAVVALGRYIHKARLLSGVNASMQEQLSDSVSQSESMTQLIATLEKEVELLTLKRLPGLLNLRYDEVITLDNEYVKNIVFTQTGKIGDKLYEYKLVLENHRSALQPSLKIILFDRTGVQIGASELNNKPAHGSVMRLDQDEIRTHYSFVKLPEQAIPEYFQIILL